MMMLIKENFDLYEMKKNEQNLMRKKKPKKKNTKNKTMKTN